MPNQKRESKKVTFDNAFGKLCIIEWDDSQSNHGWRSIEEVDEVAGIKSAGFLLREGKNTVTISTSVDEYLHFIDQLTIPRSAIRKIKKVKLDGK